MRLALEVAGAVRRETGIPSCAVGLIMDFEHAERIVGSGQADLVAGSCARCDEHLCDSCGAGTGQMLNDLESADADGGTRGNPAHRPAGSPRL